MLEKEDYVEPKCPFCTPNDRETLPVKRILDKLDEYLFHKDFGGAVRHLEYWEREGELIKDFKGLLSVYNEFIGFYRKNQDEQNCVLYIEKALKTANGNDLKDTVSLGTTYLNVATAYKSFNKTENALNFYEKAKDIYEKKLPLNDGRLAGLYNNYALAYEDAKKYFESKEYFNKSLEILKEIKGSGTEKAITYCNLADLYYLTEKDTVNVEKSLQSAMQCFNESDNVYNGDYAYACEKCAPAFRDYGFIEYAEELEKRAKNIYERN